MSPALLRWMRVLFALALAVSQVFGSVRPDAARGVSLRHDHGSPFMSEHFQNQLKFFGMVPSFASVREPETNGVAERFIRTLKEQIVFGRIFQDTEAVRAAVRAYLDRYNQHGLMERNGYRNPAETSRGHPHDPRRFPARPAPTPPPHTMDPRPRRRAPPLPRRPDLADLRP